MTQPFPESVRYDVFCAGVNLPTRSFHLCLLQCQAAGWLFSANQLISLQPGRLADPTVNPPPKDAKRSVKRTWFLLHNNAMLSVGIIPHLAVHYLVDLCPPADMLAVTWLSRQRCNILVTTTLCFNSLCLNRWEEKKQRSSRFSQQRQWSTQLYLTNTAASLALIFWLSLDYPLRW